MGKKATDKEKRLVSLFNRVEGEKSQDDVLFYAETTLRAQEALKQDYGLMGPDAALFNGVIQGGAA